VLQFPDDFISRKSFQAIAAIRVIPRSTNDREMGTVSKRGMSNVKVNLNFSLFQFPAEGDKYATHFISLAVLHRLLRRRVLRRWPRIREDGVGAIGFSVLLGLVFIDEFYLFASLGSNQRFPSLSKLSTSSLLNSIAVIKRNIATTHIVHTYERSLEDSLTTPNFLFSSSISPSIHAGFSLNNSDFPRP
jgi:hypothetical protein